jgi:protein required for attachment to host cells
VLKKHKSIIVENSESLQITEKLVESTTVKTNHHDNHPSCEQKRKKQRRRRNISHNPKVRQKEEGKF